MPIVADGRCRSSSCFWWDVQLWTTNGKLYAPPFDAYRGHEVLPFTGERLSASAIVADGRCRSSLPIVADGRCRLLPMAVADRPAASGGTSRCWYRRFLYRAHDCRGPGDGLHAATAHNGQGILGGQRRQTRCGVGSVLQHPPRTRRTTGRTIEANVVSYSAVINACRMGGGIIVFSTRS